MEEEEKRFCLHCGEELDEYNESSIEGLCEDCVESCEECGQEFEIDTHSFTIDENGNSYCSSCANMVLRTCEDCGAIVTSDSTYYVNGYYVCGRCYEDNYSCCDGCGETFHVNDLYNGYCEYCHDDDDDVIHSYDYKPYLTFYGGNKTNMYMGVELEIDQGGEDERKAQEIMEDIDEVYAKHDGSINRGFELVTHPCTLDYHLSSGFWKKLTKRAIKQGYRSHQTDTCGLHVHVNKESFNDELAIAKSIIFLEKNFAESLKFSRRTEGRLRQWANRYFSDEVINEGHTTTFLNNINEQKRYGSRYRIVNVTNEHTVEFRMFRGSLKLSTIYATLQFIDSIVKISNKYSLDDILNKNFLDYEEITDESKTYLNQYLRERGILGDTEIEEIEEEAC